MQKKWLSTGKNTCVGETIGLLFASQRFKGNRRRVGYRQMAKERSSQQHHNQQIRMNYQIRGHESVRVVSDDGKMLGTMSVPQAVAMAEQEGLDLVEISRDPAVCKITDGGRFKYEMKKKNSANKQVVVETKTVALTPHCSLHDLQIKARQAESWLAEGSRVALRLQFRAREITHPQLGFDKIKEFLGILPEEYYVVESRPSLSEKILSAQLRARSPSERETFIRERNKRLAEEQKKKQAEQAAALLEQQQSQQQQELSNKEIG